MRKLTLTFDNGPWPGITPGVLDALDAAGLRATFFLVGTQLEQPEGLALARRARDAGHRFGNHTYSHGAPLGLREAPGEAAQEILRMHALMEAHGLVGEVPLFRPNGRGSMGPHLLNEEAVRTLEGLGASVVLWSSVPKDRAAVVDQPDLWVEDARRAVEAQEWTLMVLHDRPSGFDAPGPMQHLPAFLAWARANCEITDELPERCVPLRAGVPTAALERYVTRGEAR